MPDMPSTSRSGGDFAGPWFEARREERALDWQIYEKLCGLFGEGAVADDGCDEYDWSLEVYMTDKVPADWACSELQRDVILSWGFARFWINFSDDTTEQYCDAERLGKRGPRNRPARKFEKRQPIAPQSETQAPEDPGTAKLLAALVDRAYKIFISSVPSLRVTEQDADSNDPLVAWMSDVRSVLYRNKPVPDVFRDILGKGNRNE